MAFHQLIHHRTANIGDLKIFYREAGLGHKHSVVLLHDGVVPSTDGPRDAARFVGPREHRVVAGAGHNPPQEAPDSFVRTVWELMEESHHFAMRGRVMESSDRRLR